MFGYQECPLCGEIGRVRNRRLNTSYADDKPNWMESCEVCFGEAFEYYADLWAMYYADCF